MKADKLHWFELRFPRELDDKAVFAALSAFSGLPARTRVVLDLAATADGISHRLAVTPDAADGVSGSLRAAVPSLHVKPIEPPKSHTARRLLWQLAPATATIRSDDVGPAAARLLASCHPLGAGEALRLMWSIKSTVRPRLVVTPEHRSQGHTQAIKTKLAGPGVSVCGELSVQASSARRTEVLVQRIATALRSLNTPHGRLVADPMWLGRIAWAFAQRGRYLSVNELAAVIGWPIDSPSLPGLDLGTSRRLIPSRVLPSKGRVLGTSNAAGPERPVAISPIGSTRGLYILGPVGTGKTSLIKNLVCDDLNAGRAVVVIETNGDLIQDLLDLIPKQRIPDVVLLDPTDRAFSVGFNPLASTAEPSLVADQLNELFERIWSSFWGPRTAQLAHMGLLTLARRTGSTLLDLPRLYLDPTFRARLVADLDDPIGLGPDWQWFEALGEREAATVIAPLMNKVRAFTARPSIRAIVGQAKPAISMTRILAERKVLLVHLPKGLIGAETAQLLGCLVLTSLWQATTERSRLAPEQRRPFGLYVDEVQDFASAPIPWDEMFAQGRKYGLSLTVAHQNLEQLPRELRAVILANTRSKAIFSVSSNDAKQLERLFAPHLTAADLLALEAHVIAAIVALDNGSVSPPVTLTTPAPPKPTGSAQAVRASSREHYAESRAAIEAALRSAHQPPKPSDPAPIGRKARSTS